MNNFEYDKKIFNENCGNLTKNNYVNMNKIQLTAALTIDYHRIEKGLAMEKTTSNFGVKSKVLQRLYKMMDVYSNKFNNKDKILKITYHCLLDYYNWHINKKIKINCYSINKYLKKYEYLEDGYYKNNKIGGILNMKKEDIYNKIDNIDTFFTSRRSIRKYKKIQIDDSIIKKCVYNALYGTPTICNRSINKIYVVKDSVIKKKILSLQNGNKGFGENAPIILVITTCLQKFQNSTERRSPYIGGGMFAMSIIYTLHSYKLATCCLNWDVNYTKDILLRKILKLNNETIIMMIAVGHYPDEYDIAISTKLDVDKIIKII